MIAKFLKESVLMKNSKSKSAMGKIFDQFGRNPDPLTERDSYYLADDTPGSWFAVGLEDNEEKKCVFFSYSHRYRVEDEVSDRIAVLAPDILVPREGRYIFSFGYPVPMNDKKGIKNMSAFTRDIMKKISRLKTADAVLDFIWKMIEKHGMTDWSVVK